MSNSIQLSVITVNFNNLEGLKNTAKSVGEKSWDHLEWIVVDGGSQDGSEEFLAAGPEALNEYISEPDNGIYDAMNKGIGLAMGDWVIFMNAGDVFYPELNLHALVAGFQDKTDAYFGDVIAKYGNGFTRISQAKDIKEIWKRLPFSHQSLFVRRFMLLEHPFDLAFPICADYEFCAYWFSCGKRFVNSKALIAVIEAGGLSEKGRRKTARQIASISQKYFPSLRNKLHFQIYPLSEALVEAIKLLLPNALVKHLTRVKYRIR